MTELLQPSVNSLLAEAIDSANTIRAFERGIILRAEKDFDWDLPSGEAVSAQWSVARKGVVAGAIPAVIRASGLYECMASLRINRDIPEWPLDVLLHEPAFKRELEDKFGLGMYDDLSPVIEGFKLQEERVLCISFTERDVLWKEESGYTLLDLSEPDTVEDYRSLVIDEQTTADAEPAHAVNDQQQDEMLREMLGDICDSIQSERNEKRIKQAAAIFNIVGNNLVVEIDPLLLDGDLIELDLED